MRKQLLVIFLIIIAGVAFSALSCQPEEEEEFDEAALIAVDNYVEEMTEALSDSTLRADLMGWSRDYYEDEMPFYYDEERREWLGGNKEILETLRRRHRENSFPEVEEIADWQIVIVRGEREWMLEGEEVITALGKLDDLYDEVTGTIAMIINNEGELDMPQSEQVLELLEEIDPVVEEVRSVFYR